jgi:hypothetical protein
MISTGKRELCGASKVTPLLRSVSREALEPSLNGALRFRARIPQLGRRHAVSGCEGSDLAFPIQRNAIER